MGRDSTYTPEIAAEICTRLAEGESLRAICTDLHMPAVGTVMRWLHVDEEFREQYARARELQAELMADELLAIADDGTNDWMEKTGKNGDTYLGVDSEHIQRSKLRIDTRKWVASKLLPKKYGDRVAHELSGPDGGPIKQEVTDERRAALTLALLGTIGSPLLGQRPDGPSDMGAGT